MYYTYIIAHVTDLWCSGLSLYLYSIYSSIRTGLDYELNFDFYVIRNTSYFLAQLQLRSLRLSNWYTHTLSTGVIIITQSTLYSYVERATAQKNKRSFLIMWVWLN